VAFLTTVRRAKQCQSIRVKRLDANAYPIHSSCS